MFRMMKNNVEFEVSIQGLLVRIVAMETQNAFAHLYKTIAATETTMAQLHLNAASTNKPMQYLMEYFERKGWTIVQ